MDMTLALLLAQLLQNQGSGGASPSDGQRQTPSTTGSLIPGVGSVGGGGDGGGGALSGGLSGAASGAALGSFFPGIGTAIGAVGGGALGALGGALGGGGKKKAAKPKIYPIGTDKNPGWPGVGGGSLVVPGSRDNMPSNGAQNASGLASLLRSSLSMSPSPTAKAPMGGNPGEGNLSGLIDQMSGMNPSATAGLPDSFFNMNSRYAQGIPGY